MATKKNKNLHMKTKLLIVNNYDSFVYNLVHLLQELNIQNIDVVFNDEIKLEEVKKYDKILLSPGPGIPSTAGKMNELIQEYANSKSILGVCLGHQAIAENFGMQLKNLAEPLHGVKSKINITTTDYLFKNTPNQFLIGHYHSWVVENNSNKEISITSFDERGNVMSITHNKYDVKGLQFHPESILTEFGKTIMQNWINN
jgi:anthranilate synthase component 2